MASNIDKAEEAGVTNTAVPDTPRSTEVHFHETGELVLPPGFIYKRWTFGHWMSPWYASPKVQLIIVSFVCFLCPGMFNALSGLGGGGKTDATLADDMVRLYITSNYFYPANHFCIEHRSLLNLRCVWFLWWYNCQQAGRQADPWIRWSWLLHLCYLPLGF